MPGKTFENHALSAVFCGLAVVFALLLPAAGAFAQDSHDTDAINSYHWKIGTMAPNGVGYSNQIKRYVLPLIDLISEGEVHVKVYWGGLMGDDADIIRKMRFGHLNGAGLSGQGATILCPEMAVLELPFLFTDYDEVDYIEKVMHPVFSNYMEKSGVFLYTMLDQDFDQIYSVNSPLAKVSDFSKARFLTWYGPLEEELLKALGCSPIPVSGTHIAPAINDKIADAAIAPAIFVVGSQLFTTIRYVNPVKIRYSPAVVVLRLDDWKALPERYHEVYEVMHEEVRQNIVNDIRRDNQRFLAAVTKYGVKETRMSPAEREKLRAAVVPLWQNMAGRLYPEELLTQVLAHLTEFREKKAGKQK
ncbi:MAG: TRAP transporter substrate-binding protein DctP [Thermodesulfobacteriota bacterium]